MLTLIVHMRGQHSRVPLRLSATRGRSSKRGQKSYGDRSGKRGTRTSLIAGKRGKELLAPVLFKGSTNTLWFNQWLKEHLLPELKPNSTIILDNARFHRKEDVFQIVEEAGHKVLFLPPYSRLF